MSDWRDRFCVTDSAPPVPVIDIYVYGRGVNTNTLHTIRSWQTCGRWGGRDGQRNQAPEVPYSRANVAKRQPPPTMPLTQDTESCIIGWLVRKIPWKFLPCQPAPKKVFVDPPTSSKGAAGMTKGGPKKITSPTMFPTWVDPFNTQPKKLPPDLGKLAKSLASRWAAEVFYLHQF